MKPSIPKGTRDFTPSQLTKRNYIFDIIKKVFIKYGFQPIETPTMENLSTLTGKYGEEGDKLLFKVLNSGDFTRKAKSFDNYKKLTFEIAEKGLRYDLTVPFARYVVMHRNDIVFPFKRYQIQPVWRADRPQKGRYREFYQCDVDIVGSDSLVYEAELVQIYDEVFANLNMNVEIKLNNRKILAGIADVANLSDSQFIDMTVAIDKLDKVGMEGVRKEMRERGIGENSIEKIEEVLEAKDFETVKSLLQDSTIGKKGVEEIETVFDYLTDADIKNKVTFDVTLARGLNYYTGCIFEVKALDAKMGSIGGGGRYDDLTSMFGMKDMSGVGVSFGAERIYDVMEELDLFPKEDANRLKVLFVAFDAATHRYAYRGLQKVRAAGINSEIYPEPVKMKKQMKYADGRGADFVAIAGDKELENDTFALKNMTTGEQRQVSIAELIEALG